MKVWQAILDNLLGDQKVALLYVIDSQGSSPGRAGFKMMVNLEGDMVGSIGGGFMEHKLVELARSLLDRGGVSFIKHQVHRKDANSRQSGMICSGEQTVAFYFLDASDRSTIQAIVDVLKENHSGLLKLTDNQITFNSEDTTTPGAVILKDSTWMYQEQLGYKNQIYIIGGGHVGLALSKTMNELGFYVVVFDDREQLNTMEQNCYAHRSQVINYNNIATTIPEHPNTYVVIMTFGYRPDKLVLRQLLGKEFKYMGMMGSAAKVRQLLDEMLAEGLDEKALAQVHSPVGLSIGSQTPTEIAISIAAEIIAVKNGQLGNL